VIFSCSKDKDVEEEVIISYSLSITSAEGGTVNDSAGLYESMIVTYRLIQYCANGLKND